ncbi:hypothetical protein ACTXT7_017456, partial [Hymenolepis weldensis]
MAWHDERNSWEVNSRHLAEGLQVSEERTTYKECYSSRPRLQTSFVFKRGRFMWIERTEENRSMRAKGMLKKLKQPDEEECLWFVPNEESFHQDEKVKRRHDRWLAICRWTPLKFQQLLCMRTRFPPTVMVFGVVVVVVSSEGHIMTPQFFPQSLRVNADADTDADVDADAYVEILQTIVNPPWINSVANGGRPYVFQQDSTPSHGALDTQDYMDGREFSSSCHTTSNLWLPPNCSPDLKPSGLLR